MLRLHQPAPGSCCLPSPPQAGRLAPPPAGSEHPFGRLRSWPSGSPPADPCCARPPAASAPAGFSRLARATPSPPAPTGRCWPRLASRASSRPPAGPRPAVGFPARAESPTPRHRLLAGSPPSRRPPPRARAVPAHGAGPVALRLRPPRQPRCSSSYRPPARPRLWPASPRPARLPRPPRPSSLPPPRQTRSPPGRPPAARAYSDLRTTSSTRPPRATSRKSAPASDAVRAPGVRVAGSSARAGSRARPPTRCSDRLPTSRRPAAQFGPPQRLPARRVRPRGWVQLLPRCAGSGCPCATAALPLLMLLRPRAGSALRASLRPRAHGSGLSSIRLAGSGPPHACKIAAPRWPARARACSARPPRRLPTPGRAPFSSTVAPACRLAAPAGGRLLVPVRLPQHLPARRLRPRGRVQLPPRRAGSGCPCAPAAPPGRLASPLAGFDRAAPTPPASASAGQRPPCPRGCAPQPPCFASAPVRAGSDHAAPATALSRPPAPTAGSRCFSRPPRAALADSRRLGRIAAPADVPACGRLAAPAGVRVPVHLAPTGALAGLAAQEEKEEIGPTAQKKREGKKRSAGTKKRENSVYPSACFVTRTAGRDLACRSALTPGWSNLGPNLGGYTRRVR
nr:basic proline-rich protein-like [Aegilops tauschii subsp. strangulata]